MPQEIAHYHIIRTLGEGGIGTVYLGEDTRLHRLAAIKTLRPDRVPETETLRRFQQEALAASALNHPHLMVIYDFGRDGDLYYIACEYIEGDTLRHLLNQGPVPIPRALEITQQLVRALGAAHAKGIVHRDLKPENIMIRPDGYIKVLDFGLAKLTRAADQLTGSEGETVLITNPGALSGTPEYMSPEQAEGADVDTRSDLFSTGSMLYEMVTGQKPFHGRNITATLLAIVGKEPAPLSVLLPQAPASLETILSKALRKRREQRYQTADELLADLNAVVEELLEGRIENRKSVEGVLSPFRTGAAHPTPTPTGQTLPSLSTVPTPVPTVTMTRRRWLWPTIIGGAALAGGGYWGAHRTGVKRWDSIAVLPFTNVGGDPEKEYLSQGLTDNIIGNLSRLRSVRVLARSTVSAYKGDAAPTRIGKALNVAAVLSGRVTQSQDSVSVEVELADAETGTLIWGEPYRRRMSDLYSVDQEIARDITERLRLELSADDRAELARKGTTDSEVYRLYLRGKYELDTVSAEGRRQAVEYFRKAIERDPGYAPAYAGLGEAYATLAFVAPPADVMPPARNALRKAIELDEKSAMAHTNLAFVLDRYDWDWSAAEKEYRRAIQLDPRNGRAHTLIAIYLARHRRFQEAVAEAKEAAEVEPDTLRNVTNIGWVYYFAGQYDQALAIYREALRLGPDSAWTYHLMGCACVAKSMHKDGVAAAQKAVSLSPDPTYSAGLVRALAASGRVQEARHLLDELVAGTKTRYVPQFLIAWTYAALGDKEEAFRRLGKAVEDRDPDLAYVRLEPQFAALRAEPSYRIILKQLNLKP